MILLEEAGVYNIGYQNGIAMLILVNSADNFYAPFLRRLSHFIETAKAEIIRYSGITIPLLAAVLVVITFAVPVLFFLLCKNYKGGTAYVFWVELSSFF